MVRILLASLVPNIKDNCLPAIAECLALFLFLAFCYLVVFRVMVVIVLFDIQF